MAILTVPVSSVSPQDIRPSYTGNLIVSLVSMVEKQISSPLAVDEVLDRSASLDTVNPYEALVRSVGRWL